MIIVPNLKRYALYVCVIPGLLLTYIIYKYLTNLPTGDDIFTMEMFNQLREADTFPEKVKILFSQHNEHRIFVTRLFALLQYRISGFIDLRWWIIAGNLCFPFVVWIFFQNVKQTPWLLIPIAFILFTPISNTFAAMQNANLFSVLFCIAAFHFSLKSPYRFSNTFYVFALTLLGILSNGGGFVCFGLIGCVFFFQRRYRLLIYWILFGVLIMGGYFWDYQKIYKHPTTEKIFEHLPEAFYFLLAFLGGIALKTWLAKIIGVLFLGLFLGIIHQKYYLRNPFIFLCFTYGIAMGALSSLSRYEHDINVALAERYVIYSMLLAVASIVIIYDFLKNAPSFQTYAFVGLTFLAIAIHLKHITLKLKNADSTQDKLLMAMENYHLNRSGYTCMEVKILDRLAQNGFYSYPIHHPVYPKNYYDSLNRPPIKTIKLRVDKAFTTQKNLHLHLNIFEPSEAAEKFGKIFLKYLVFQNDSLPFDCQKSVFTQPNNDQTLIVDITLENGRRGVSLPQLEIILPKKHFKKGKYDLYFLFFSQEPVNFPPIKTNVSFRL